MVKISEESVHVKILPSEAVLNKKSLLEIELHSLNIMKNMLEFKELRKLESKDKSKARVLMNQLSADIDEVLNMLPHEERGGEIRVKGIKRIPLEKEKSLIKKTKSRQLETEMQAIKDRLAKLEK